jgi:hypothetical protein
LPAAGLATAAAVAAAESWAAVEEISCQACKVQ